MDCLVCKDLERAFASKRDKYIEARSAAYYRISTELAAFRNVDIAGQEPLGGTQEGLRLRGRREIESGLKAYICD